MIEICIEPWERMVAHAEATYPNESPYRCKTHRRAHSNPAMKFVRKTCLKPTAKHAAVNWNSSAFTIRTLIATRIFQKQI